MRDSLKLWIDGARPRTLPAAFAPVIVGASCAGLETDASNNWLNGFFALLVSVALQVGVNYANDYSDGIRGTDQNRVGPLRLVGSGLKSKKSVKLAAFISFGVAAVFGLLLAIATSYWLIAIGVACLLAGWFYTGGKNPYGYLGFGELFVFIFFGLVATVGTTFVIAEKVTITSWLSSIVVGCLACALLSVNNLRDIDGDRSVGKRTLAVRLGEDRARGFYVSLFVVAMIGVVVLSVENYFALFGLVGLLTAWRPIRKVQDGAKGTDLIQVLVMTGRTQISTAVCLSIGLVVSRF